MMTYETTALKEKDAGPLALLDEMRTLHQLSDGEVRRRPFAGQVPAPSSP